MANFRAIQLLNGASAYIRADAVTAVTDGDEPNVAKIYVEGGSQPFVISRDGRSAADILRAFQHTISG